MPCLMARFADKDDDHAQHCEDGGAGHGVGAVRRETERQGCDLYCQCHGFHGVLRDVSAGYALRQAQKFGLVALGLRVLETV